jgi:flagellar hook-basal body complex protein FliE
MSIPATSLGGAVTSGASAISHAPAEGFTHALASAVQQVNDLQSTAEQKVTGLLSGDGQDIHSAALSVERASLAFDLMLQVRNKVVSAYQEISRLQF